MAVTPHFELITDLQGLQALVAALSCETLVACDLEADSLHHYREQVCLLQFSTPTTNYLLDPLAIRDLSLLAPFFANPAIRKVFHGADYDVRSLHRDFGIEIANLFDTMIACQFLGEKEWGLAAALRKRFGVELDKQFQTADWSRRPLPTGMLAYAVLDTAHLLAFYEQVATELATKGRLAWVEEECRLLTTVRATERVDNEPLFLRCKGAARLLPRQLAVLEALLQARNQEAAKRDRPPFKIIGSDILLTIATAMPQDLTALGEIADVPVKLLERNVGWLLAAARDGQAVPEAALPSFPVKPRKQRSATQEACIKRLKEWRAKIAADLVIEPGVLIANAQLENLCEAMRGSRLSAPADKVLKEWQIGLLEGDLRAALRPK